jgi:acetoin utilization deacetylase AcuC-like enzyme
MGGYCYLNNAAAAAALLLSSGAKRVAILDVDYHHGNGTQDIFYGRSDVLVVNIHADPRHEYPYFSGFADERGRGAGEGFNVNIPLPPGTGIQQYLEALNAACDRVTAFAPDAIIVSLGVDTYIKDPIGTFKLRTEDYPSIGKRIAGLGRPTLFVLEGGYAVPDIGPNVAGVLQGFEG